MKSYRQHSIVYLCTNFNEKSYLGLEALLEDDFNVIHVITYVRPRSSAFKAKALRFLKYLLSKFFKLKFGSISFDVKELTSKFKVPLTETSNINLDQVVPRCNISQELDIILSNGWMFKISSYISSLAKLECLNCHSSYLPEYRGGNITYAPLINKEKTTGVTVHQVTDKFDSGQILYQTRIDLDYRETPKSINHKRALATGKVLIESLRIAGHVEKYKLNPPSPFYYRCSRGEYRRIVFTNKIRGIFGLPLLKYKPK